MKYVPASSRSLLIHDGELADVRALLTSLSISFIERIGTEREEDRSHAWDLVIASARRLLELQLPSSLAPPAQIAILSHDARTLRSSLRRTGTTLMVCRPVHPAALRALVLHALYRGPEKRRSVRVNVGAPVGIKLGWRQRPALLIDLSVSGCRLLTDRPLEPGAAFRLQIPAELARGRALAVEARVLDSTVNREPGQGRFVTTAVFDANARAHAQLHAVVASHAEGPAMWRSAPRIESAPIAPRRAGPADGPSLCEEPAQVDSVPDELEEKPLERLEIEEPLDLGNAALDEEAARVLMGRDLSRAGMRVEPNPQLAVGMKLRLAVHAETREAPLILHAIVDRDDGERGLMLRFQDLSAELSRYLDYVIHALPLVIDDDDDEGCLVTELIEAV
jgi:hypothetical protein